MYSKTKCLPSTRGIRKLCLNHKISTQTPNKQTTKHHTIWRAAVAAAFAARVRNCINLLRRQRHQLLQQRLLRSVVPGNAFSAISSPPGPAPAAACIADITPPSMPPPIAIAGAAAAAAAAGSCGGKGAAIGGGAALKPETKGAGGAATGAGAAAVVIYRRSG